MLGRRKKYLHPVRMYVFTSAVFFLVFFSLFYVSENDVAKQSKEPKQKRVLARSKKKLLRMQKQKKIQRHYKGLELLGYNEADESKNRIQ
jgi:hypothetical protein